MKVEFQTPDFSWSVSELKGNKQFFVEGFVSTTDIDDFDEVVTDNAQDSLVSQVKGKTITMDIGHSEWVNDTGSQHPDKKPASNLIPVAKIVEAERRGNGTWIKAQLNSHSPKFKEIWGSIKDGFLHSFSIAFHPLKAITKNIKGKVMRFIDDLNLINVTITGVPVNPNATMRPVLKAFISNDENYNNLKTKGDNMTNNEPVEPVKPVEPEPVKPVEPTPAAKPVEPEPVKPVVTPEEQAKIIKTLEEKQEAQAIEVKALTDKLAVVETAKADYEKKVADLNAGADPAKPELLITPLSSIKSKINSTDKEIALLKAKLSEPILKGHIEIPNGNKNNIPETEKMSLLKQI